MDPILHLPLTAILAEALPRDRSTLDPAALAELQSSIAATGLRHPSRSGASPPPPTRATPTA